MTAVIVGLVAVVLLVLLVVALGMRSMNRRESALSSERIKAMAENKGPKPRRPAEETFFESFPKGFDAFEEPEPEAPKPRPASTRPGSRQARPAQRGGKQPAAARGKRGVDEWGEPDDYDDDYWSRVRADEGGFGGTIAARMATPRPVQDTSGPASASPGASQGQTADADAVTVQAPLPPRPAAGRADAPVPASAMAEQKTMTFAAPTPDLLDAAGSPATGPFDAPATPAAPASGPFAAPAAGTPAGTQSGRPGRSGRSSRAARRAAAVASADAGQASGSYDIPRGTGPFTTPSGTGSYPATPGADALDGVQANTGPMAASGDTGFFNRAAATGPFPATGGTGSYDGHAAGSYDAASASPIPETGTFVMGNYDPARGSGAFEAAASPVQPIAQPADALAEPAPQSDFDPWTARQPARADAYDPSQASTGPFPAARPSYSPTPEPPAGAPGNPALGNLGGATDPGWPVTGSYPPAPAASAPAPGSNWAGARDVLDDPEPSHGSSSWPNAETYQTPAYDGYQADHSSSSVPPPVTPSYEVNPGWASIDASDSVTGTTPGSASPYESAGYDAPSGQSQYGYDQQQQGYGGTQPSWPEQNMGGSWPSYDELYGDASTSTGGRRRGSHRDPDTDYPDYYR
ncbi:hypothetical protein [Microbispora triticiradicis]|uniref:Uncharacterized protein n=2 Tax=Microbispora TaxID=2005 RepID=A0ABY3LZZ0_9ACTN|nr:MULTISPECIES: hypothetical protein [Microbispora]TLP63680.1 hypothetical protein FED44_05275 [Microbispora fusca]TYB60397.1 hypothetical protein FXF59_13370 [Microbispora tritici]